jgi:hypothetical protein
LSTRDILRGSVRQLELTTTKEIRRETALYFHV